MKTLPLKFIAGSLLLVACTLPLSAGRNAGARNAGSGGEPRVNDGTKSGHKRSDAEKQARQTDHELRRDEAVEKRRAEMMKRFDANADGKLDDKEKAAMEAALKKQEKKRDGK